MGHIYSDHREPENSFVLLHVLSTLSAAWIPVATHVARRLVTEARRTMELLPHFILIPAAKACGRHRSPPCL